MGRSDYVAIENEPHPDGSFHSWSERRLIRDSFDHVLFSLAAVIYFGKSQGAFEKIASQEYLSEEDLNVLRATNEIAQTRFFEPVVDLSETRPLLHPHVLKAIREMVDQGFWSSRPPWRIF